MVDEIEFGEETTRVYVTVRNRTKNKVSFFTHNARIVQGSTQVDPEPPSPSYDFPKIQSDLNPGVETEGVVVFGPVDPARRFTISFDWSSSNFRVQTQPLVFEISP